LVLGDLSEHLEALLDDVSLDDLEDLLVLEDLTRDVKGKIVGIDDTLNEGEPLGAELLAVILDKDSSDVELEVVLLLLVLEEIEGSSLGNEEEAGEFELTLNGEVLDSLVLLPVESERLVEGDVLVLGNVIGLAHPDGRVLVESLELVGDLLDLLVLLLLGLVLLNLRLVVLLLLSIILLLGGLIVGVSDLLVGGLLAHELDGEANELGVLLDEILDAALLNELGLVLLKVENDLGTTGKRIRVVGLDGESATGVGLPLVLGLVVLLGDDGDSLSDKIGGVETDTELTNHADIGTSGDGLHETSGSGLGDGTKVVAEVRLGHTDTGIVDGEGVVDLVGDDLDAKVGLSLLLLGLRDGAVADLVERIGSVGDELSKEDLLVGIEGVDNQRHQLLNIGIELEEIFGALGFGHLWKCGRFGKLFG
jgi:hypothetical protein